MEGVLSENIQKYTHYFFQRARQSVKKVFDDSMTYSLELHGVMQSSFEKDPHNSFGQVFCIISQHRHSLMSTPD